MNPGMRFLEFYWIGVCIIQLWVSTLWVHTLHMCTVSQNLILFANGFPGSRVWVWSRGPQWVCKEYFCKFCLSIGRMRSQQADNSDNTDWNPTLCPPHAPTGRSPSPCVSWVVGRMPGKGEGLFLSQASTSVELAFSVAAWKALSKCPSGQLGGHPPWNGTQRFYMKGFSLSFFAQAGGVLCTRETEEDKPQQFISRSRWCPGLVSDGGAVFQGRALVSFTSDPHRLMCWHLLKHTLDWDGICCLSWSTKPPYKSLGQEPPWSSRPLAPLCTTPFALLSLWVLRLPPRAGTLHLLRASQFLEKLPFALFLTMTTPGSSLPSFSLIQMLQY